MVSSAGDAGASEPAVERGDGERRKQERSEKSVSDLAANMIVDVLPEANFYDSDIVSSFTLTPEEVKEAHTLVEANDQLLPQFTLEKLERDAVRNWDVFYKHNQDNFFKDRLWIKKEFPEFAFSGPDPANGAGKDAEPPLLVDVGCGVGNALVPILRSFPHLHAVAFDCSKRAVQLLKERWAARVASLPRRGCRRGQAESEDASTASPSTPSRACRSSAASSSPASVSSSSASLPTPHVLTPPADFKNPLFDECLAESAEPNAAQPPTGEVQDLETSLREDGREKEETEREQEGESDEEEEDIESWELRKEREANRLHQVITLDITENDVPASLAPPSSADYLLLLFVLSALHPRHHVTVARRCASLLKPGGIIFFRDYGRYDLAQLRFAKRGRSKVAENAYARHDGTLACYFLTDELRDLFCREAGLEEVENRYCLREFTNRKTEVKMRRIWIQAKFRRPPRAVD